MTYHNIVWLRDGKGVLWREKLCVSKRERERRERERKGGEGGGGGGGGGGGEGGKEGGGGGGGGGGGEWVVLEKLDQGEVNHTLIHTCICNSIQTHTHIHYTHTHTHLTNTHTHTSHIHRSEERRAGKECSSRLSPYP